ncbi:hypothetical protein APHCRT_1280 [Anaplasma phagocytophilum str. CRT53-1]|uniref:Uncharacterized protein n=1 Tax=Anaplasma phagocytophilum str. CRT53-1 TaxID=1359157 RepID=A0A0F3PUN0_ANAPH|nr:hypothetical protein APHCRT_1280 [Anaplasma phagocytophilum str. CRT53-1]
MSTIEAKVRNFSVSLKLPITEEFVTKTAGSIALSAKILVW